MQVPPRNDVYSVREIALAAAVQEDEVRGLIGRSLRHVPYDEALRIGRTLKQRERSIFFAMNRRPAGNSAPLVVSTTLHVAVLGAAVLFAAWIGTPIAVASATSRDRSAEPMRIVFLTGPGPGGGGGGGGLAQRILPPKALRAGQRTTSSPIPARVPPRPVEQVAAVLDPTPALLTTERLPVVVAPIVTAPADSRDRIGALIETSAVVESHGSGRGGGIGSGTGTGIGEGNGSGVGPGSGGGFGGGAYRAGSGIEPPRVLHEIKADYTEDGRRRGITGDVLLEIVVRRDGSVGDVKVVAGLDRGLDERAVQAVRQWRFSPARRQGTAVDVIVEVAVEFKLR